MNQIQELETESKIEQKEFDNMTNIMFNSLTLNRQYKSAAILEKKEDLLEDLIAFFNKYLALKFTGTLKHKLEIINFIEKLTMQKELIALQTGRLNLIDIQDAAKNHGKKSQSAVGGE